MKAVFLDRDGVIIQDKGYVHKISDFKLLPGVAAAIKKLNDAGFLVIIITNQSGVARGYFTEDEVRKLNQHLVLEMKKVGAHIDAVYYCPHYLHGTVEAYKKVCDCRKPRPGMILRAAEELHIDITSSWMIGNAESDVLAGKTARCRTILLTKTRAPSKSDLLKRDLNEAVDYILEY